ncbi:MAG: hypothetical protein Q8M07_24705, partial [Prosthecobacter sp.]|nr:hypothetical protein [Prosthecobacter sp.]
MDFTPSNFDKKNESGYWYTWAKSDEESVAICVRAETEEELARCVENLPQILSIEPRARSESAHQVYPNNEYWLNEECGLDSAEAFLAVLQLSMMDIQGNDDGTFRSRLVYFGPNEFQTSTAKHVFIVDIPGCESEFDADFDS